MSLLIWSKCSLPIDNSSDHLSYCHMSKQCKFSVPLMYLLMQLEDIFIILFVVIVFETKHTKKINWIKIYSSLSQHDNIQQVGATQMETKTITSVFYLIIVFCIFPLCDFTSTIFSSCYNNYYFTDSLMSMHFTTEKTKHKYCFWLT